MGFKLTKQRSASTVITCPLTPNSSGEFHSAPMSMPTPGQTVGEKQCFRQLKKWCWESGVSYDDTLIRRFACHYSWNIDATKQALEQNQDNHLLGLQMRGSLVKQFDKCALFPLSGLKTKVEQSEVCYFRPSRFNPNTNDSSMLIKNLCYVLNGLSSTEEECRRGVAFMANMKSFETKHYKEEFWLELLDVLQGNVIPTTVSLFLILNPPTWFGRIWRQIKTRMSPDFCRKVRLIEDEDLDQYFHYGYQSYMPDDIAGCWRKKSEMVEDYIDRRVYLDKQSSKKKKAQFRERLDLSLLEVPLEL